MGVFGAYPGSNPSIPTQVYADPAKFGAAMNGVNDDSPALAAIATQANGNPVTVIVYGPLGINSYSPPANMSFQFIPGGYFKRLSGQTLTYNNNLLLAGPQKIMDITNTGSYVGPVQVATGYDEWFGASPLGVIPSSDAINASSAFSHQAGDYPILTLPGNYLLDKLCYGIGTTTGSGTAPSRRGAGMKRTYWNYAGLTHGIKFIGPGGSGLPQGCQYENMSFKGDSSSVGVIMAGVVRYKLINCGMEDNLVGFQPFNEVTNTYTEYCEALACDFRVGCLTAVEYKVGSGNDSFNGTGLNQRCTVNIPSGGTAIQIDAGAKPYIAPLDAQFWTNGGAATLIANNSTVGAAQFAGKLSYEQKSGSLVLGTTNPVYFTGIEVGTGDTVTAGTFIRGPGPNIIFSDSTVLAAGSQCGFTGTLTTGANTIPSAARTRTRLVEIQVAGTNFDYEYTLIVRHQGYGGAGRVTVLSTLDVVTTAGYGAGAFTVNSSGDLILTNNGYPGSGLSYVVYETILDAGHLPLTKHLQY